MTMLWLVTLLLGSSLAVANGEGVKWRLLNVVIILGCMGLGYGLGYSLGLWAWLFGKRSQPGFTTVHDVRNRRSTRMLVAE